MKKMIAVLAALMLVLLCAAAPAEESSESAPSPEAMKLFSSEWVDNNGYAKIYPEEGHWRVIISSGNGAAQWDYSCRYDAEQKALVADQDFENIKYILVIDDEGSEINRATVYIDGAAVFTVGADGKLAWKDEKEDAGAGRAFEKIGWFQGTWTSEGGTDVFYELNCYWDVEVTDDDEVYSGYKVEIERYEGEAYTHWAYACAYNPETDTLSTLFGSKEYAEKEGEPLSTVYQDGAAEFSFDDEGCIIWKDAIENAGEGLQFTVSNG